MVVLQTLTFCPRQMEESGFNTKETIFEIKLMCST
jgi:hypothetical protein